MRNSVKGDSVFSRARQVLAAETPALLQRVLEKEESVGRKSRDESCGSGLEVRSGYLDSGGSISASCGCGYVSIYCMIRDQRMKNTSR